jgi:nicotinamidase/pyrazinamidase
MAESGFQSGHALIVVDVQRDFCAGGALPIPGGDDVVPVLNEWINAACEIGAHIVLSREGVRTEVGVA